MTDRLINFSFLFSLIFLIGCNSDTQNTSTFFGGKIINPNKKDKFVVLYANNEKIIDTFYLNNKDKFLGEIPDFKEGLYYFKHGLEHQYIYLEESDSLLLRLNTWDFDESLVYSGKGAARNNMLIDCFLDEEKESEIIKRFYKYKPAIFKQKLDSLLDVKISTYDRFISKHPNETNNYKEILKISLIYPIYSKIENYPLTHFSNTKNDYNGTLEDNFYIHRKDVDYNKKNMLFYFPYRDFIVSNLYNKIFTKGHKIDSDEFTTELLKEIDNSIKDKNSRNALLRQTILGHFYRKSSCYINKNTFSTFFNLSTNKKDKSLITHLLKDINTVYKGKKIPDFYIKNYNHSKVALNTIIKNKNAVVYFWNPKYISKDFMSSRVNFLMKKFPDIEFVGVKIDGYGKEKLDKIDIKYQYFTNESMLETNRFISSKLPRTFLVNKQGIIINGYASFSSNKIYKQIKDLASY